VTALLAIVTVLTWGAWIPLAQVVPGIPQRSRTFYTTAGNVVLATIALVVGGGHLELGWRTFWLPFAGGVVWTGGNYSAFRASETIGLARAAGTWTPLNIVVAFVWGALLFGELNGFSATRFVVLGATLALVLVGVLLIVGSRDSGAVAVSSTRATAASTGATSAAFVSRHRGGLAWACVAGVLWGSYFVPAQWAKVPSTIGNFPLALGIVLAGLVLALSAGEPVKLSPKVTAVQLSAGLLFGTGNIALLGLVKRVGTGEGFTIAQLSLLVNTSIGIWVFKVPKPGSRAARVALVGILLAGAGGVVIGALGK
jgi:glucose uptake protein